MSCPMIPTGIAAACDWAFMVPCLFGDVTKPPETIFVRTLMLPVSRFKIVIRESTWLWQSMIAIRYCHRTSYCTNTFSLCTQPWVSGFSVLSMKNMYRDMLYKDGATLTWLRKLCFTPSSLMHYIQNFVSIYRSILLSRLNSSTSPIGFH